LNGRSGSGIWLHGTPSTSYSRPPLASDGCVVLTNPDLEKLFNAVNVGITPVVISEHAEFTTKKQWLADRDAATHLLDNWRRDLESMNTAQFLKNYAPSFKSAQGEDLASWSAKHAQSMAGIQSVNVKLQDETIFAYPDRQDLIVATFTQNSMIGKHAHQQRKRQYWLNAGGTWKIVYEGNL
jgi:murein L,D-transpeptidase YafK